MGDTRRLAVVLAPGGPGLGAETLWELPLPEYCLRLYAPLKYQPDADPVRSHAEAIVRLVKNRDAQEETILVGHSAGASATLLASSVLGKAVRCTVLIAAQVTETVDNPGLIASRIGSLPPHLKPAAAKSMYGLSAELPLEDSDLIEMVVADLALTMPKLGAGHLRFLEASRRTWNAGALRRYLRYEQRADLAAALKLVQSRILVINGQADPWAGEASADRISKMRPDATVAIVPGAGHVPWIDSAKWCGQLLGAACSTEIAA